MLSTRQREQAREIVVDVVDEQPTLAEQAMDGNRFAGLCLVNVSMRRCSGDVAARGAINRGEVTDLVQDVLAQLKNGHEPEVDVDDVALEHDLPLGDVPDDLPGQKSIMLTKEWQIVLWHRVAPVARRVLKEEHGEDSPANGDVFAEVLRGYVNLPGEYLANESDW